MLAQTIAGLITQCRTVDLPVVQWPKRVCNQIGIR